MLALFEGLDQPLLVVAVLLQRFNVTFKPVAILRQLLYLGLQLVLLLRQALDLLLLAGNQPDLFRLFIRLALQLAVHGIVLEHQLIYGLVHHDLLLVILILFRR